MSVAHMQLVKWSLPAFALLVGFFWYKRRRVDRVDPGGVIANNRTDTAKNSRTSDNKDPKTILNLYDSGIHIDESFGLNSSQQTTEETVPSPRRVSESLDIPNRRSGSQGISIKSEASLNDNEAWYEDVDDVPEPQAVVLGSNPKSANFEMITRNKNGKLYDGERAPSVESKIVKSFDKVAEEDETNSDGPSKSSVEVNSVSEVTDCRKSVEKCSGSLNAITIKDGKNSSQVICERDSANHSPVSGVLEESVTDEVRSEGSTDSGKGGSINGHGQNNNLATTYEFAIAQHLVGRLIGKRGEFLHQINAQTGVTVTLKRHPSARDKLCEIAGSPDAITEALKMIRQKFPENKFRNLTLEQISVTRNPEEIRWASELMHLSLIEGVNNDIIVCHILKPGRLFVQLPTHPTYPSLKNLDQHMTQLYDTVESPPVPDQLERGMLVVVKWYDLWVRAYVENPDPEGQRNYVRLVDHGGYWTFSNAEMRKIRFDYLTLPFQAIEVFLSGIQPVGGEWQQGAYDIVAQICSGSIGQVQIEGYIDSNVYVSLYMNIQKHGVISLADELIARGYAEPVTLDDMVPDEHLPIA